MTEARAGDWRLGRVVSAGALAEVREADSPAGDVAAVKRLHAHSARDPALRALFADECRLTCALPPHPALVRGLAAGVTGIIGDDDDGGRPYLVMPLVAGRDLRAVLEHGRLDLAAAAHRGGRRRRRRRAPPRHGWVHGDVNPANLIVEPGGAVVCDLGVARRAGEAGPVRGTAAYMAPEQVRGEAWTAAVDVFALGVVLWELVERRAPVPPRRLVPVDGAPSSRRRRRRWPTPRWRRSSPPRWPRIRRRARARPTLACSSLALAVDAGAAALRAARSARRGLALDVALALEIDGVAGGARAEHEAEQHADEGHQRDEEDVAEGHDASSAFLQLARQPLAISTLSACWRRHMHEHEADRDQPQRAVGEHDVAVVGRDRPWPPGGGSWRAARASRSNHQSASFASSSSHCWRAGLS